MATKDLIAIQAGKETVWGTAVSATALLAAVQDAEMSLDDEVKTLPAAGSLTPATYAARVKASVKGKIKSALTYEDVLYALAGVFGIVSPTGTGPYTWTFTAPETTAPAPQTYTLEVGQSGAAYKAAGVIFTKFTLALAAEELGTWSADVLAKSLDSTTMTSGLQRRAQNLIRGADAALYIDSWGGTFGTTVIPATLIEAELSVDTGRHLKWFADGSVAPSAFGETRWKVGLKVTAEFTAQAKALVDAMLAGEVKRLVRIRCTSGTNQLTIDLAGIITGGTTLWKDRDGNCTVELEFAGLDADGGPENYLTVQAINGVAALQ